MSQSKILSHFHSAAHYGYFIYERRDFIWQHTDNLKELRTEVFALLGAHLVCISSGPAGLLQENVSMDTMSLR